MRNSNYLTTNLVNFRSTINKQTDETILIFI